MEVEDGWHALCVNQIMAVVKYIHKHGGHISIEEPETLEELQELLTFFGEDELKRCNICEYRNTVCPFKELLPKGTSNHTKKQSQWK